MTIPNAILDQHVAVLGKTRSGKSSVMRGLVESLLERQLPVCIVDPKGDWWGIKLAADGKGPGYPVVIFGGEHADVPINDHAGAHVAELFATGNRPCLIDLGGWTVAARTRFWIDFASTLFKHAKGQRWLAVDEIHNFAPKGKVFDAEAGKALHWTNRLASEGLGKGIALLFASQRPQKVHNDTLTSAETLIAMRVLHPADRSAVADWIKGCGDASGDQVLGSLAQMERGEGWAWSPEIGFGPKRVKFPLFRTYDSFRPQSVEDTKRLKGWAEVDLDEVRMKLAAVVEQAKADDPKELRKQIADLKGQLDRAVKISQAGNNPPAEIREKPVIADAQIARLDAQIAKLDAAVARAADILAKPVAAVRERLADLSAAVRTVRQPAPPSRAVRLPAVSRAPIARSASPPDAAVTPAKQKILNALAFFEGVGVPSVEKVQLALMAGVPHTSGGYKNNLGALRSSELITYPSPGEVSLTDAGRAIASVDDVPQTTADLHHALRVKLPSAKWRIVEELVQCYPDAMDKGALADACGVPSTSGGFKNNLGSLRTLGLIDYPQPGTVAALPVLFLDA